MDTERPPSLYDVLAEAAPEGAAAGETRTTRRKETIDDDAERLDLEIGDL